MQLFIPVVTLMTREPFVMPPENRVPTIERITRICCNYNMRNYGRRIMIITIVSQRSVRGYLSPRNYANYENFQRTPTENVHDSGSYRHTA